MRNSVVFFFKITTLFLKPIVTGIADECPCTQNLGLEVLSVPNSFLNDMGKVLQQFQKFEKVKKSMSFKKDYFLPFHNTPFKQCLKC